MKVILLQFTKEPEELIITAARMCYSSENLEGLLETVHKMDQKEFLQKILSLGHVSVLEHASFTFGIEGISRAASHQLVRHRLASYAQKSQRYVREKKRLDYIIPQTIAQSSLKGEYEQLMEKLFTIYRKYLEAGIPAEDARYILPNSAETKLVLTMNARELMHFFQLRCCNRSQWEIQNLAEGMLLEVKKVAPLVFQKAGPPCLAGDCPEGKMSCGRQAEARKRFRVEERSENVS